MCHNTVALDDQVQLEKCTRSLFFFHAFMYIKDLWPDLHARVLLRICVRWSFGRMFGCAMHYGVDIGEKQKGTIFWVINMGKAVDLSVNYILYHECDFTVIFRISM